MEVGGQWPRSAAAGIRFFPDVGSLYPSYNRPYCYERRKKKPGLQDAAGRFKSV